MEENTQLAVRNNTFESLRKQDSGREYWSARDLCKILGYRDFRNFYSVIEKAKIACENSHQNIYDHFVEVTEMVEIGSGASRPILDMHLSRYACYLIVQNGDSSKPIVAKGQTYFAIQTRRQELSDEESFESLDEEKQRILLRKELRHHNKLLVETANKAGVETEMDFAVFQNHGYKGLYEGLDAKGIHKKKGLKQGQAILDHMGSTELAANLFRATQAETPVAT